MSKSPGGLGGNAPGFGRAFSLGFEFVIGAMLFWFLGRLVDSRLGTEPWGQVIGAVVGWVGGTLHVYYKTKGMAWQGVPGTRRPLVPEQASQEQASQAQASQVVPEQASQAQGSEAQASQVVPEQASQAQTSQSQASQVVPEQASQAQASQVARDPRSNGPSGNGSGGSDKGGTQ